MTGNIFAGDEIDLYFNTLFFIVERNREPNKSQYAVSLLWIPHLFFLVR